MMIRQAPINDSQQIALVHVASRRSAYSGIIAQDVLDRLDVSERAAQWTSILSEAKQCVLVACDSGRIGGFVSFGSRRDADALAERVGEITSLYVHPDDWGSGTGTLLCRMALERLAADGYQQVTLRVLAQNERGRRFYETMGFAVDGASDSVDAALRETRYRMSLTAIRWSP